MATRRVSVPLHYLCALMCLHLSFSSQTDSATLPYILYIPITVCPQVHVTINCYPSQTTCLYVYYYFCPSFHFMWKQQTLHHQIRAKIVFVIVGMYTLNQKCIYICVVLFSLVVVIILEIGLCHIGLCLPCYTPYWILCNSSCNCLYALIMVKHLSVSVSVTV